MEAKIKCIKTYDDIELNVRIENKETDKNYIRIVPIERAKQLESLGKIEILEIIEEQPKEKAVKPRKRVIKR